MKTALIFFSAFLLSLALLAGCSFGGGDDNNPPPGPSTTPLTIKIGDDPVDSIVAFEITVNSVVLNQQGGGTVTVLSSPTRIELTHLAGAVEPLNLLNVPQGTYTSATVTLSDPEVTVISGGQVVELNATLTSGTVTVSFSPAITIGATPTVLSFDLNLGASVVINGSNASITPTFTVTAMPVPAPNNQDEEEEGELDDLSGRVTSVGSSSFTVSDSQTAATLTFTVDSNTEFELPLTGLGSLSVGMLVEVDAVTQADASLLAREVEGEDAEIDLEVEGVVTSITGAPPTSFEMVVQETEADGGVAPALGEVITVNLAGSTEFDVEDEDVELSGLPFPTTFINTTLARAQRVEVDVDVPSATSVVADKVKLEEQTLRGQVTAITSQSGGQVLFTLTVDADSVFAQLTGQTAITTAKQPGTELDGLTTISVGQNLRVRGLLFFNSVTYNLVAEKIDLQ